MGPRTTYFIATMTPKFSFRLRSWANEYGSVFTLKLGPANIVVLCDRKAIHKLLVEKGANFSDRPNTYVGHILTNGDHVGLKLPPDAMVKSATVTDHQR